MQQPAALGGREHRDGSGRACGAEVGPFQRVDSNIDFAHRLAVFLLEPDLLADVEHRGFIALAFTDDDGGRHGHSIQNAPHRLHRRLVGQRAVAPAHGSRRIDRSLFHHPHEF